MRLSTPDTPTTHREAAALREALDDAEQLSSAYDAELLESHAPLLQRAREAISRKAPAQELVRVRRGLEDAIAEAAAFRADDLAVEHGAQIDALMTRSRLLSQTAGEVAAVIVDPRSPHIPAVFCARVWPISIELAPSLAQGLAEIAPGTAEWLREPGEPDEHKVVVFTLGRVMRTTRKIPRYADA